MESCVNNSSYWSHPECVLICMLTDAEDPALRLEAIEIIKECRRKEEQSQLERAHQLEEEEQLEMLKKVKKSARPTKTSACKKAAKPKSL